MCSDVAWKLILVPLLSRSKLKILRGQVWCQDINRTITCKIKSLASSRSAGGCEFDDLAKLDAELRRCGVAGSEFEYSIVQSRFLWPTITFRVLKVVDCFS